MEIENEFGLIERYKGYSLSVISANSAFVYASKGYGDPELLQVTFNSAPVVLALPTPMRYMHFIDENTGVALFTDHQMRQTIDGGKTWNIIETAPRFVGYFKFFDAQNAILAGDDGIQISSDGGVTWADSYKSRDIYTGQKMFFLDTDHIWIQNYISSDDGGATWQYMEPGRPYNNIFSKEYVDRWIISINMFF